MKKMFIVLCCALLCSCNNYRNKSVFEIIPESEIISKAKNDTLFLEMYDNINGVRDVMDKMSSVEKAKFYKITYADIMKALGGLPDSEYDSYHKQWEKEFGADEHKLDSISRYYRNYLDNATAEQYLGNRAMFIEKYGTYPKSNEELLNSMFPEFVEYWKPYGYIYKESMIKKIVNPNYMDVGDYIMFTKYPLVYEFILYLRQNDGSKN